MKLDQNKLFAIVTTFHSYYIYYINIILIQSLPVLQVLKKKRGQEGKKSKANLHYTILENTLFHPTPISINYALCN